MLPEHRAPTIMAKQVQKPIEFITPPNVLRAKLKAGSPKVVDPLAAADSAMEQLTANCELWVLDEIEKLQLAREAFAKSPKAAKRLTEITRSAVDLKGLAVPAGYIQVHAFVSSLVTLLTAPGNHAAAQVPLVEAHVDAIRAARDNAHSAQIANALAKELAGQTAIAISAES